jgi:hypothetical protein
MKKDDLDRLIGRRLHLPGHFEHEVRVESVRALGSGLEIRVRLSSGELDEAVLSSEEVVELIRGHAEPLTSTRTVDPEKLRLLVESARIRLAYTYDRQFAVSLSGIRTLPHQIEAVYLKMLPQPRLRFLLADDPGAGKTIMGGLLVKELKLREAIERVLILVPAPLTIQWQDELIRFFGESFQIIHAGRSELRAQPDFGWAAAGCRDRQSRPCRSRAGDPDLFGCGSSGARDAQGGGVCRHHR